MLAGQPPFTGPTAQAVLARHAMDPVPSLRTVRPTLAPELCRVVERALAKVRADRYPTAAAFGSALAAPGLTRASEPRSAPQPRARGGRRVRHLLLAGGLVIVSGAGLATVLSRAARARHEAAAAADPAVIAIAPFRVSSADPGLGYLREGLVDLLAARLSGTRAVHPVDSRTLLSAWRGEDAGEEVSEREAVGVARRLGAGQVVMGDVVAGGSRVTLSAALLPVAAGRPGPRVTVEGPSDSLAALIDGLAVRLLARAAGEPEERLPALAETPMAALRAYLDGWFLLRRNNLVGARTKFEDALAADSTLVLAALGASRAIFESSSSGKSDPVVRLAWRLRDRLTPRDQAYLEAILGPRYPETSRPAELREAAARFTQVDPTNADAWNAYGIFTCDLDRRDPDIDARCRTAYHRAVALDSTNGLTLFNATDWAATLGDTASARRALRLYLRLDPVSPASVMLQWLTATRLGDTVAARRAALSDSLVSIGADWNLGSVWQMLVFYVNEGRGLSDAELVLRRSGGIAATGAQRAILQHIPYRLALMRGRADGLPEPRWFSEEMSTYERVANALFADADPALAVAAAGVLERQVGLPITGGCCLWRFAAAEWALQEGRLATARRAVSDMERYPRSPEGRADPGSGEVRVWPLIVRAQLAARERSPAATDLLRRLDSALIDHGDDWEYGALYGNLIAARLHEARQQYKEALEALRRRDASFFWPVVVTYHREEGRIAAEAGDTTGAIRAFERYLRIRNDVEPRLRPQVRQIQAELAALRRSR